MSGEVILVVVVGALVALWGVSRWQDKRRARRRDSLRRDEETGQYYWTDLSGTPQSSRSDPSRKGGAWESEDAASFGGGDAGDGGGGGGD